MPVAPSSPISTPSPLAPVSIPTPLIRLDGVSKRFALPGGGVFDAVRPTSLSVERGEIFGLVGKSGAGKSTLLRLINLLERPDGGRVLVNGRDLTALGSRYPAIVGDAAHVADELQSWVAETGIDGFNLARTVTPECHEAFVDLVVPELQRRGVYKTAYAPGSLRHKLHGEGDRLPARHAAQAFRRVPD